MARKGKKNNKKNKKTKKNYTQREFTEVFCQTCLICERPSPVLCYKYLYKHEPKHFVKNVFNNLIDIHEAYMAMARPVKSMSIEQFQSVVCRTGICFNGDGYASASCDRTEECYQEFQRQLGGDGNGGIIHEYGDDIIQFKSKNKGKKSALSYTKKRKKKKKKARYVCESYPTFFCRDDEQFKATVRRILYGDNDNEQDSNQELSASNTGAADRHTEGGESKV
jgi:hypothetical protein